MRRSSFKILLTVLLLTGSARAGDPKAKYDLSEHSFAKGTTIVPFLGWSVKQPVSEFTVLPGFFLTWGTVNGKSSAAWDNASSLLFGHPYAKTSYPVIGSDGTWKRADEMFPADSMTVKLRNDSTLIIRNAGNSRYTFEAVYQLQQNGSSLRCFFRIINTDTASHSIGFGHYLDAALSNRGDAVVTMNGQPVTTESSRTPAAVILTERTGASAGIGAMLDFPAEAPSTVIVRNWMQEIDPAIPFIPSAQSVAKLYDAVVAPYWSAVTIASKETLSRSFDLTLLSPNFGTVFTRWDLPRCLTLEDGMMHPFSFTSIASVINNSPVTQTVSVELGGNNFIVAPVTKKDTSLSSLQKGFLLFPITVSEIYENSVAELSLITSMNGTAVDTCIVPMFIPKTPVSDTGLTVTIDTLIASGSPKIAAVFEVERTVTRQKFFSLSPKNVFLYENDSRIPNFTLQKDTSGGVNSLDLVFVLDVTGSMGGTIDGVKNNIIEFADSLSGRGIDYRIGMVTFLDEIENVYDFTNDANAFKQLVSLQFAHGGGDAPENSLDALFRSTQYPFRAQANRLVIWITDITYHENNGVTSRTKAQVVNALLQSDITVHAIGPKTYQTAWYNPIIEPTGGKFYDIYGNFRDILLDISRLRSSSRFLLTYTSPLVNSGTRNVKIEVHVAGLGGNATGSYSVLMNSPEKNPMACFPNPFNPQTTIRVFIPASGAARITIYDILGKQTRQFEVNGNDGPADIVWDATDQSGRSVSSGVYVIRSEILSKSGSPVAHQTSKVIYLK